MKEFYLYVVIIIILFLLLIFALYWEWSDYSRLLRITDVKDLPPEEQIKQLQFLACYNFENGPQWREVYIAVIILALVFVFSFGFPQSIRFGLLVLLLIFIVFYGILSLNSYHIQRIICSKAKDNFKAF